MNPRYIAAFLVALFVAASLPADPPKRPWMGMAMVFRDNPHGARFIYVANVLEGLPAYEAGIRPGDILTAIDGKKAEFRDELAILERIAELKPETTAKIAYIRDGKEHTANVRVGTLPAEYEESYQAALARARQMRAEAAQKQ